MLISTPLNWCPGLLAPSPCPRYASGCLCCSNFLLACSNWVWWRPKCTVKQLGGQSAGTGGRQAWCAMHPCLFMVSHSLPLNAAGSSDLVDGLPLLCEAKAFKMALILSTVWIFWLQLNISSLHDLFQKSPFYSGTWVLWWLTISAQSVNSESCTLFPVVLNFGLSSKYCLVQSNGGYKP